MDSTGKTAPGISSPSWIRTPPTSTSAPTRCILQLQALLWISNRVLRLSPSTPKWMGGPICRRTRVTCSWMAEAEAMEWQGHSSPSSTQWQRRRQQHPRPTGDTRLRRGHAHARQSRCMLAFVFVLSFGGKHTYSMELMRLRE